jgi:hypothetical protein
MGSDGAYGRRDRVFMFGACALSAIDRKRCALSDMTFSASLRAVMSMTTVYSPTVRWDESRCGICAISACTVSSDRAKSAQAFPGAATTISGVELMYRIRKVQFTFGKLSVKVKAAPDHNHGLAA